jgi:hypothetical protein
VAVLYAMAFYTNSEAFTKDARRRYDEVIHDRSSTSYDRWWTVVQIIPLDDERMRVLWARVAPLRKG